MGGGEDMSELKDIFGRPLEDGDRIINVVAPEEYVGEFEVKKWYTGERADLWTVSGGSIKSAPHKGGLIHPAQQIAKEWAKVPLSDQFDLTDGRTSNPVVVAQGKVLLAGKMFDFEHVAKLALWILAHDREDAT